MHISIDTDELAKIVYNMETINRELSANMECIENLVLGLGFEWQGKAELAYEAKILYLKKQYGYLNEFINDYCMTIKGVINDYREVEKMIIKQLEV